MKPDGVKPTNQLSAWIIIGAVVVLFPIMLMMSINTIQLQRSSAFKLLTEKGQALIRAFEAGTRAGIIERSWGWSHFQRLLSATASQPDIAYIILTDSEGKILAHSDPSKLDSFYHVGIDLESLAKTDSTLTRTITIYGGHKLFEVVKRFLPSSTGRSMDMPRAMGHGRGPMMMHRWRWPADAPTRPDADQILFIYVGLEMDAVLAAQQRDIWHIILMAAILFLVGIAGVALVFLTHNYRQATSSLSKVKAFSDQVVKQMPVGLLAWDEDDNLAAVNPAATEMLDLKPDSPIGRPIKKVLPGPLLEALDDNIDAGGKLKLDRDVQWSAGNRQVALQLTGAVLMENGRYRGYVCLLKDMREIIGLRKQVERHQRLATMGRLAAGVAHEIRNPLSSIKGFATYFKERCDKEGQNGQIASLMIQEVDRLNRVVTQLLEFSRPVQITPRKVRLESFIKDCLRLIQDRAQRQSVALELKCLPQVDAVFDPDQLKQVLINLFLNALDAMPSGGSLEVRAELDQDRHKLRLEVVDSGQGMEQEVVTKIFDPYFTTKSDGTGLGMAIVHNIVEAHNGRIVAESQPGQGSKIKLELPLKGGAYEKA